MSRANVTVPPACLWYFTTVLKQASHALLFDGISWYILEHKEQLYILSPGLGIRRQIPHCKSSNLTLSILPNDFLSWFRKKRQKFNLWLNSNMAALNENSSCWESWACAVALYYWEMSTKNRAIFHSYWLELNFSRCYEV